MVRREGTRFGVSTGHSVRRSAESQKTIHSSQNIVVKATTDVKVKRAQKQASSVVENHLQNRALNLKGFCKEAVLPFSLNKNKRWEVVDSLKKEVGRFCSHDNHITVSEHHIGVGNPNDNDCTAVYDSMSAKSKCSPRKTYARTADLVRKDTDPSTDQLVVEDEAFGTKNRRRRQKKKVKVDKRTGIQEEAFAVNVSYEVNVAAPKHTLYTFPKRGRFHGMDDMSYENVVTQATKQGKKKMKRKIAHDIMDDLHSLRELDPGDDCNGYDDDWEVIDEVRCIPMSEVKSVFGMFAVAIDQQTAHSVPKRNNRSTQGACTKERKFQIELEEPEKSSTLEVEDNALVKLVISADNLLPEFLRGEFGENYQEAYCFPRRFAIDITDRVISKVPITLKCRSTLSEILLSTGYQVFAIYSLPKLGACQDVEISATVIGERFNRMDAEKVIYGYRGEIKCLSDSVERIADVVANKVKYRWLCELDTSHSKKVKCVKHISLTTVGSSLNWDMEIQSQRQIWKEIVTSDEKKHSENTSGRLIPTSCENLEGVCRICYSNISEMSPGTCLQTCNHLCCDECWKGYLITKVSQGDPHITCPEFNCKVPVDQVILMSLVPYKLASFHLQQKINATVAADKHLQWCPNKGCGRVGRFTDTTSNGVSITCKCGFVWCTKCMQEVHWPATCVQAATYRAEKAVVLKYVNAENTSFVDMVKYKNCPKCNNPIEKIFGCNYMMCPCKCTFCWLCGELYPDHGTYGYKCMKAPVAYETFEFDQKPMEHVYQLSVMHHFKASGTYSSRRSLQAHKLADKVAVALALEKNSEESNWQAPDFKSTKAATFSMLRGGESGMKLLEEIKDLIKRSSDFLLEAYSVLEFLEILLESSPPCDLKRQLYQQRTRLLFISQQLDDILNLKMLDLKGCLERVKTLCDNGKRCLSSLAKIASDLSNMREVPTSVRDEEL